MEDATMSEEDVLAEIEQEIERTKKQKSEDFEIEVVDSEELEPSIEENTELVAEEAEPKPKVAEDRQSDDPEYSKKVQRRIKKLVDQRKESEARASRLEAENNAMMQRLEKLEQGSQSQQENQFVQRYEQTKLALKKAVEEGDTDAQVDFQEQLADMRAAIRVNEMQRQQAPAPQAPPPPPQQQAPEIPDSAKKWIRKNDWFKASGYERETLFAKSIDVQLEMEGYDKESDEYYVELTRRLQKTFPDVVSEPVPVEKARTKRRNPVAPTSGGQPYSGNRVRLSKDQLAMARELGITDEQKLKVYESEIRKQRRS